MELQKQIKIHMLMDNEIIETFDVGLKDTSFTYDGKKYKIEGDEMYLFPSKDSFLPTLFYKKGIEKPIAFYSDNKSIPARALHLLWNHSLYRVLITLDSDKTNLIIIILLIVNIAVYGIRLYFSGGI